MENNIPNSKRDLFEKFFDFFSQKGSGEDPLEDAEALAAKKMDRRTALRSLTAGAIAGGALAKLHASPFSEEQEKEKASIKFKEFFRKNYKLMTKKERSQTIQRLERLSQLEHGVPARIETTDAIEGVLYGYAFNVSKCKGYMDCVKACVEENNQDRESNMQYIRIFEFENGQNNFESANGDYSHEVPLDGHYYLGTQCFHCENPPCTKVCPVGATWKEKDGIVVVDYDWCIGCRYCEAACPYFGRRFNWSEPSVPQGEVNPNQHYLGNRMRKKGVMEKCTFCVQRTRKGQLPACVEACPTGARVFGNLLDPESEIRYVLENKKVFRLKEELGTEPKFWYYMD